MRMTGRAIKRVTNLSDQSCGDLTYLFLPDLTFLFYLTHSTNLRCQGEQELQQHRTLVSTADAERTPHSRRVL
jgi:hypothetical protein